MEKIIMSVVLEPAQKEILERLANEQDRSQSAIIRRLIEQENKRQMEAAKAGRK